MLGSHAPCPLAESWQEQAPGAAPKTHPAPSADHCTARRGCKSYLKIAKHNVCCEAFPLLSLPPVSWSVSPATLSYFTSSRSSFFFLSSQPPPLPWPGRGSPCTSPVLTSLLSPSLSIEFLKVPGTQHCARYLNRIRLGIQASNKGLFLPLPCNSPGSATHNSSDYKLLPGRLSAFCPRLLLSRCFTPIEFGFGVIFPTIRELYSSGLDCFVASYPQLQSLWVPLCFTSHWSLHLLPVRIYLQM